MQARGGVGDGGSRPSLSSAAVVCANGVLRNSEWHYDRFALRARGWYDIDVRAGDGDAARPSPGSHHVCFDPLLPQSGLAYPVDSCFGGLAIYRRAALRGCRYSGEGGECEHVMLHRCMRAAAANASASAAAAAIVVQSDWLVRYRFDSEWTTELGDWQQTASWGAMAPLSAEAPARWVRRQAGGYYWRLAALLTGRVYDAGAVRRLT